MITDLFAKTRKRAENNAKHAKDYIHGLLSETPRKNSEAIADALQGTQEQDLQNFISDSSWDHSDVFAHVAREANRRIGGHSETMLAVDESCFTKKGGFSAGVGRMYNGHLGKVDNCQVGVFSSLTNGSNATLIGARLLLPAEWIKVEERCLKAGIPTDKIKAASKIDFARELIEQADAHGVQYARIGLDAPQEQLARHQGQRHFIERNFQNSKSHLGMADYQVRKWSGWHRHMAMVALAGLFVMEERMLNHKALPLLSTRDVVQILDWYFRENPTLDSIIEQIENRHHRRRRVSKSKIKISAKTERKIAYEK